MKAHNGEVATIVANKNNVISGGADGILIVWSYTSGILTKSSQISGHSKSIYNPGIRSLDLKQDGTYLIGTRSSEIYEGKQSSWNLLLQGHYEGELWGCAVSPSNYRFATAGGDKTVRIWDMTTRSMITGTKRLDEEIRAIDWSNNGKLLVGGDVKGKLLLFDVESLKTNADNLKTLDTIQTGFKPKPGDRNNPWIEV